MKLEEIYDNLCVYDPRNECHKDLLTLGETPKDIAEMKSDPCFCDNCFYGRNELAQEILKLRASIEEKDTTIADMDDKIDWLEDKIEW